MTAIAPRILRTGLGEVPVFEMGSGPHHVVLLHASSTGPMAFKGLAEHLAREERTIVMPAFAGYHDNALDCSDPFETNCQIAVSVVNSREGDRCTLFGHSMGGLIATNAVARGANVDAFAVYEPIVVGALQHDNREDMDLLSWDQNIIATLHAEVAAGRDEAGVAAFVEGWNEVAWSTLPESTRERLVASAPLLVAETRTTTAAPTPTQRLSALDIPKMVLHGENSPPLARRLASRLAERVEGSKLTALDGVGHMAPALSPQTVALALEGLLCA